MEIEFKDDEKLFRAVWPESNFPLYWKEDGTLSSAALRDKKGLSVERAAERCDSEALKVVCASFEGHVVSFTVGQCNEVNALVVPKPTKRSSYHTEIHGSQESKLLTKAQARHLARNAIVEVKRYAE